MSVQKQASQSQVIEERLTRLIDSLCSSSLTFEHAYDTYTQQYGRQVVTVNDPINLANTIQPVILVLGRNTPIQYSDPRKTIFGSLGSLELKPGSTYIIGRREPQDSRLVVWDPVGKESDLETYNPEAGVIPSRIHAAIVFQEENNVLFSDLGSSSGSVIVGEVGHRGAFVCVYDPGSVEFPRTKFDWISTERKD